MGKGGRFPYVDFVSAMRMAADRASSVAASAHADGAQAELQVSACLRCPAPLTRRCVVWQRVMWRFYRAYKARRHELVTMLRKFGERHHDALPAVELRRSLRQFTSVTESGLTEDDLAMVTNYFFPDGACGRCRGGGFTLTHTCLRPSVIHAGRDLHLERVCWPGQQVPG